MKGAGTPVRDLSRQSVGPEIDPRVDIADVANAAGTETSHHEYGASVRLERSIGGPLDLPERDRRERPSLAVEAPFDETPVEFVWSEERLLRGPLFPGFGAEAQMRARVLRSDLNADAPIARAAPAALLAVAFRLKDALLLEVDLAIGGGEFVSWRGTHHREQHQQRQAEPQRISESERHFRVPISLDSKEPKRRRGGKTCGGAQTRHESQGFQPEWIATTPPVRRS